MTPLLSINSTNHHPDPVPGPVVGSGGDTTWLRQPWSGLPLLGSASSGENDASPDRDVSEWAGLGRASWLWEPRGRLAPSGLPGRASWRRRNSAVNDTELVPPTMEFPVGGGERRERNNLKGRAKESFSAEVAFQMLSEGRLASKDDEKGCSRQQEQCGQGWRGKRTW